MNLEVEAQRIAMLFCFNVYRYRKPLNIMPIKYTGTESTFTQNASIEISVSNDEIGLLIRDGEDELFIYLDELTAVQFAKDIRRSIAKIKEVKHG